MKSYSILFHAVEWLEKHRWDLAERLLLFFFLFVVRVLCIWIYKSVGGFQLSQHSTVEMSKLKELLMSFSMNMKCQANKIEIGGTGTIACVFADVCVCVLKREKNCFFLLFIRSFGNNFLLRKWSLIIDDDVHDYDDVDQWYTTWKRPFKHTRNVFSSVLHSLTVFHLFCSYYYYQLGSNFQRWFTQLMEV